MKRWNQKGTVQAKARMAELSLRKLNLIRSDLIVQWSAATGRPATEWYEASKAHLTPATEPMAPADRVNECIAWLRSEIAARDPGRLVPHHGSGPDNQ